MSFRELIEQNDKEAIKKATEEGFDPNGKDETLLPWLIVALRADHFGSLEGLLQAGARPEGPEGDPLSPLMVAVKMGKPAAVDLLLRFGANPNRILPQKRTALHLATTGSHALEIVNRLLAADANPNLADEKGWTPLMKAASEGNLEIVERLLKAGSNKDAFEVSSGKIAWDLAKAAGHDKVCAILGGPMKAAPAPPAPVLRMSSPTPTTPRPPVKRDTGTFEKLNSEPVKPWQVVVVVLIGLLISAGLFWKVMSSANM